MFSKLLLIGSAVLANAGVLTLQPNEKLYNPGNSENFYYLTDLFSWNLDSYWDNGVLYFDIVIDDVFDIPDIALDYMYFGDFANDYDLNGVYLYIESYVSGQYIYDYISAPETEIFPFSKGTEFIFDRFELSLLEVPLTYTFSFTFDTYIPYEQYSTVVARVKSDIGFTNAIGISEYIDSELEHAYKTGFENAEVSDGNWLGNLIFGTIGGIVGLLFAISDFEVLGVSIMSIITLFVAIGIIMLLIKVLK